MARLIATKPGFRLSSRAMPSAQLALATSTAHRKRTPHRRILFPHMALQCSQLEQAYPTFKFPRRAPFLRKATRPGHFNL